MAAAAMARPVECRAWHRRPTDRKLSSCPRRCSSSKAAARLRAEQLGRLGVAHRARSAVFLPRDYQDLTDLRAVDQLEEGPLVSVLGTVEEVDLHGSRRAVARCWASCCDKGQDHLRALWFNQPFLREKFAAARCCCSRARPSDAAPLADGPSARRKSSTATRLPTTRGSTRCRSPAPVDRRGQLLPSRPASAQRPGARCAWRRPAGGSLSAGLLGTTTCWPDPRAPCRSCTFPPAARAWSMPGGGSSIRSCSILQLALALKRQQVGRRSRAVPLGADGQDRRPHPPAVSLRADRRPEPGDRRDRRRHGPAVIR